MKHASPRLRDSRFHAASSSALAVRGQGSEPRREASTTSGSTSVNKILGKTAGTPNVSESSRTRTCGRPRDMTRSPVVKRSRARPRLAAEGHHALLWEWRPAIVVGLQHHDGGGGSAGTGRVCVRACVRRQVHIYIITRTGSGSPLALNLFTARARE